MIFDFLKVNKKKKKKKFWMEDNQDAKGYPYETLLNRDDRREVIRRSWNF